MVGDVDESNYNVSPIVESKVTLTPVETAPNGNVLMADRLLKYSRRSTPLTPADSQYTDRSLWYYIQLAGKENAEVSKFVDLVKKVMKTTSSSDELIGVKAANYYTILMPNNTAMTTALGQGLYPANIDPENDAKGADKALRFVLSHFVIGKVFPDDNLPIIYPFSPLSEDPTRQICPTMLAITNEKWGLTNVKTQVVAYKYPLSATTFQLRFYATDIKLGNTVVVQGNPSLNAGANSHQIVSRTKITARPANDYKVTRSNRMACRAVIHEINGYFNFVDK